MKIAELVRVVSCSTMIVEGREGTITVCILVVLLYCVDKSSFKCSSVQVFMCSHSVITFI
jgi:hypothetical protein